ncbi:MAG: hypothetical protein HFI06_00135 [Eubacterium sp.]|jgi:hypothetical protein|nr:hypothetical protein [Eubacterium sp.]NBI85921.1 hypothetical protein [Lachnospiraceae bacterium]
MSVNAVNSTSYSSAAATASAAKTNGKEVSKETKENKQQQAGVVYEKSPSNVNTDYVKKNSALINKLKADSDARVSQLRGLVETMMKKQGAAIGNADSMWQFLAGGNFTVSADVKAQAQADIAEDGYWGVEQTSDRILDFAKALSGSNPEKADELLAAFKKGFSQATKSWGKTLPDISQRTYDAVIKKFDAWKNGTESTDTSTDQA